MTQSLTISNQLPEYPGMNFELLRQEGIKYIERLGGNIWTDYNTHDPGITILEILCYAITDLSYRLSFEMKDLLAPSPTAETQKQFYTAREILTTNPLTINDYRKVVIDIDGVKNAWLEKINEQVNIKGLYRVLIEKDKNVINNLQLEKDIKNKLLNQRNLCEDFAEIKILPVEEIIIKAEIEIEEGFDVNDLMAVIYFNLDNFISPSIKFSTLKELLDQGKNTEEVFNAPLLEHGFIENEQLEQFNRKAELYASDLIQIILDIEGVKVVKTLQLSSNVSTQPEAWVLALDSNSTPQLQDISVTSENINFYKGQILCSFNLEKVKNKLEILKKQTIKVSTTENNDISIPLGKYRELADYESIQNEFPANYGIGELGLPASATARRKAQAKQLQAYLMFFDQLLANYFAQLDHVKDLFSFQTQNHKTYFTQLLDQVPGVKEILNPSFEKLPKDEEIDLERKNRFLDYLMTQFCEKFTDYSLLLYDSISKKLIENKTAFLQDYLIISSHRGKGFNYSNANSVLESNNVSGLKLRISRLLGITSSQQSLASASNSEGFYLIEHILLRPQSLTLSTNEEQEGIKQNLDPYSFQISFVFSDLPERFKNETFKQLIYRTLVAETPAHITLYYHWFNQEKMGEFETVYQQWLQHLATPSDQSQGIVNQLMKLLKIGAYENT